MSNELWCNADGVPIREFPGSGAKKATLLKYTVVRCFESTLVSHGKQTDVKFYHVYYDTGNDVVEGWVYSGYLEPYIPPKTKDVLSIRNATAFPHDARQYLVWKGQTQFNLCGFFAVSYCIGWEADIEEAVELLESRKPSFIRRIFPAGKGRGTTEYDLGLMLDVLDGPDYFRIGPALIDPVAGRTILTPGRLNDRLQTHRIILSVRIEPRIGRLTRSGILHWVVVESMEINGFGAAVTVYNPFMNQMEQYDWHQIVESCGVPYGLAVER